MKMTWYNKRTRIYFSFLLLMFLLVFSLISYPATSTVYPSGNLGEDDSRLMETDDTSDVKYEFTIYNDSKVDLFSRRVNGFDNESVLTIVYSVPQDAYDGIVLVGAGYPGLTKDPLTSVEMTYNITKYGKDYYHFVINGVTEHIYFKGYAWKGDKSNGTLETVDKYHIIYHANDTLEPELTKVFYEDSNGTTHSFLFTEVEQKKAVIPLYANLTIEYRVTHGNETNPPELYFSNNTDFASWKKVTMEAVNATFEDYVLFRYSFNFTDKIIYFRANNSVAWDLRGPYIIKSQFEVTAAPHDDNYTIHNNIRIDVLSYNWTDEDTIGLNYSIYENENSRDPLVNWTAVNITTITEENTTFRRYVYEIPAPDGGWVTNYTIKFHALFYFRYTFIAEEKTHVLQIMDDKPILNITLEDVVYTNNNTIEFNFTASAYGSTISSIILDFGDGTDPVDVTSENHTSHVYENDGIYNLTLEITTNFSISKIFAYKIVIDRVAPVAHINMENGTEFINKVVLNATFEDDLSGLKHVYVDWGDGIIEDILERWISEGNATVYHEYFVNGTYALNITVVDRAGNSKEYSLEVVVFLEEPRGAPGFEWLGVIMVVGLVYTLKKKKPTKEKS